MCTRYCQRVMASIGRSLEGRPPDSLRQDLIGPTNVCMLCTGHDCELCRECKRGACRYAVMFTEHSLRAQLG